MVIAGFDKKKLINNIYFLLKRQGKKVGDLEDAAGVSTGYLARTSKDEKAKPSIEFVIKAAEFLNCDVNTILHVNFSKITNAEEYLLGFIQKLIKDTEQGEVTWNKENERELESLRVDENGKCSHPLFGKYNKDAHKLMYGECDDPYKAYYNMGQKPTVLAGIEPVFVIYELFNMDLDDDVKLYLMNIAEIWEAEIDGEKFSQLEPGDIVEIWMVFPDGKKEFIGSNVSAQAIGSIIGELSVTVSIYHSNISIKKASKNIIDKYMNRS